MLAYIIIFGLLALSNGATFLLDNEGWTIAGNKRIIEAKHQSYSLGSKMSNYILGTDDLVNVDARNRDDKNRGGSCHDADCLSKTINNSGFIRCAFKP